EWNKHDEKLLQAVQKGEVDKINSILSSKKSVSPTKQDPHGHTWSLSTVHYSVMGGSVDCVRLLLDNGAPVYLQDEDGRPALFLAAQMNHVPITKQLIEGGANINTRDSKQKTALILASEYGNDEVVQFLISRGADVTFTDRKGML
ncbi:hypothetical protein CAPTEDRAFT_143836, partial [Capitella teleta]